MELVKVCRGFFISGILYLVGMENRKENLADRERYLQASDLVMKTVLFDKRKDEKPGDFLRRHRPERVDEFTAKHFNPPQPSGISG